MFECLAIDDNLVIKPKDTCWVDFWLENQHLPLWRQRQLVKSCGKEKWNFEFQQNLARKSYQKSLLDYWLSTNSKNLRVFASIKTLEAKFVFMKISWRPLPIYGCFVSQYHEKINRNIFLPKCLEIDDTLVLKPKETCWIDFGWKITSWLCGVKINLSVLQGENYETWISANLARGSGKLSGVSIGLVVLKKLKNRQKLP